MTDATRQSAATTPPDRPAMGRSHELAPTIPAASLTQWPGLAAASTRLSPPLGQVAIERFNRYRDLLLDRARRVNLTAITDPDEVERRLFFDALLMLDTLDRLVNRSTTGNGRARLADIGSGAGFPGLVLAIARPDLSVTLIEATGKKVVFLTEVIRELELPRLKAIHARAEDVGRDLDHRGQYDVVTARAVASLPTLFELSAPLLCRGGYALYPKGLAIEEELAAARRATSPLGVRLVATDPLPGAEEKTRLVVIKKTASTPDRYPRRAGLPAREPLGSQSNARIPEAARAAPTSPVETAP